MDWVSGLVNRGASLVGGEERLNQNDVRVLIELFDRVRPETVIDIGTYKGKSALVWKILGAKEVISFDIEKADIPGITCIQYDSTHAPWGRMMDLVWVDGNHSYEGVLGDLKHWDPLAHRMICGHDYSLPGVKQAVDEFYGDKVTVNGEIWSVSK